MNHGRGMRSSSVLALGKGVVSTSSTGMAASSLAFNVATKRASAGGSFARQASSEVSPTASDGASNTSNSAPLRRASSSIDSPSTGLSYKTSAQYTIENVTPAAPKSMPSSLPSVS